MNAVRNRKKSLFRKEKGACYISFDFSGDDTLHVSSFFEQLASSLEQAVQSNPSVLVIELTGFRKEVALKISEEDEALNAFEWAERSSRILVGMKIPLVAAISGFICGPLLEAVLFLDFLIAARGSKLSSLMLERGYIPHMGMITNLLELVGKQGLYAFLQTGIDLSEEDPLADRIVHKTVEDNRLREETGLLLEALSKKEMYPVRLIKELALHNRSIGSENADIIERYSFALCFSESRFRENIDLFFKNKNEKGQTIQKRSNE